MNKIIERLMRNIQRWIDELRGKDKPDPQPEPPAPPAPPAPQPPSGAMPDASNPGAYRTGFLWKPVGDHDRPAVALLPAAFTHKTRKVMRMIRNGSVVETANRAHSDQVQPNGNREHYRFKRRGGEYAGPMTLQVETAGGNTWSWTVPKPAERYDNKITPEVRR
jgi:hypothetical protein